MATKFVLEDDLDGSLENVRAVQFALDGDRYSIDLSTENLDTLKKKLAPYIDAGRPVASKKPRQRSRDAGYSRKVRAWAEENKILVSPRGRVPDHVHAQYLESLRNH